MSDVAPAASERDPLLGRLIDGRYRVQSSLARGGMSRVYRAEQQPLGRTVALKVLAIGAGGDQEAEFRSRFELEASVCARLTHPNTVRVFDHGVVGDELLYIAMEYLDGRTLHQVIRTESPIPAARLLAIARQICGSLREAHQQGLIHRDLKPANVVLVQHGDELDFVKVLDFGLVKQLRVNDELTGTDAVVGSPSYMAPEQIRAERLDARTDIYSLGVILYAAVAGRAPFVAETSVGVLLAHLNHPAPALDPASPALQACPALAWVIDVCLQKGPKDRFADVEELNRALRLCEAQLRGEQVSIPKLENGRLVRTADSPRSLAPPSRPASVLTEPSASTVVSSIRSQRVPILAATGLLAVGGALLAAVAGGALAMFWYTRSEPPPAPTAETAAAMPVRLTTLPSGAAVKRDGVPLGASPLDLNIPDGEVWNIEVSASGYAPASARIPWDAKRQQITLKVVEAGSAPKAPASAPRPSTLAKPAAIKPPETTEPPSTAAPANPPPAEAAPATPPPAGEAPKRPKSGDLKDPWAP